MSRGPGGGRGRVEDRLGFACAWTADQRTTWSGTPWALREALRRLADGPQVVDVGIAVPQWARTGLNLASARRHRGRWVAGWPEWTACRRVTERHIAARTSAEGCDATIQIGDLAVLERPYFLYQDLAAALIARDDMRAAREEYFPMLKGRRRLAAKLAWQRRVYAGAAGIFAMSRWLADFLVEHEGLRPELVHVVPPGATSLSTAGPLPQRDPGRPRRRLLFLGSELRIKGGDQVVDALQVLRRDVDPGITLTVAGPRSWSLPTPPPQGVDYLGPVARERVVGLIDSHDVVVMPSRLEGFGIVFVEALGRGVPCVGRRACAMPEIIDDGRTGALVDSDDPVELAEVVAKVLADDQIHATARSRAAAVTGHYTWDRAAADMAAVIDGVLR